MEKRIIQVEEKVPAKMLIPLSIQHMFAMFGASVLVWEHSFLFSSQKERHRLIWAPVLPSFHRPFW